MFLSACQLNRLSDTQMNNVIVLVNLKQCY